MEERVLALEAEVNALKAELSKVKTLDDHVSAELIKMHKDMAANHEKYETLVRRFELIFAKLVGGGK